jgi:hypothetical protein
MKSKMSDLMRKLSVHNPRPNSLLYNRTLLYCIFFIALVNLYALTVSGNYTFVAVFILVGFITSFFSKNMIVILVIAIAISNLLKLGLSGKQEGFDDGKEEQSSEEVVEEDDEVDAEEAKEPLNATKKASDKEKSAENKNSKEQMKQKIIQEGQELLNLQEKIVNGFETIDPYMKKAEDLTKNIQKSAGIMQKL